MEVGNRLIAVEVKSGRTVTSSDLSGLRSFADFVGKKTEQIIVFRGKTELELDGVRVLPIEKAADFIVSGF